LANEQGAALKDIDAHLTEPNMPEAAKASLRAERKRLEEDYAKKKRLADVATGLTGWFTDKASVAVVARHSKELEGIFFKPGH
jgi:hypothetical protein